MANSDLYERDFYCWALENAALLRAGRVNEADLEHIAEEIEDMGKRDRSSVRSKMTTIIAHLLKWQYQPDLRGASWESTIARERVEIPAQFDVSPSLRRYAKQDLPKAYADAIRLASRETRIPKDQFPAVSPYTLEQILDDDFYPGQ